MSKELKLWNGHIYVKRDDPRWIRPSNGHINVKTYICAYSLADALRMIKEYNPLDNTTRSRVANYWNEGCWGCKAMKGVEPERGLWIEYDEFSGNIIRII
jgi:hypothetical protein